MSDAIPSRAAEVDLIRRQDVVDRVEQLKSAALTGSAAKTSTMAGRQRAEVLDDVLDILAGWCAPHLQIPSVPNHLGRSEDTP